MECKLLRHKNIKTMPTWGLFFGTLLQRTKKTLPLRLMVLNLNPLEVLMYNTQDDGIKNFHFACMQIIKGEGQLVMNHHALRVSCVSSHVICFPNTFQKTKQIVTFSSFKVRGYRHYSK
jgi:hypothetical protein